MGIDLVLTLAIVAGALALFLSNRLPPDLVALIVVFLLGVSGVLTPREAFSGFSRSATITLMSIFILARGLERAGVTARAGRLLVRLAGARERRLVLAVMTAGAFLSLFMNNIAAAAVLLPAVTGAARQARVSARRLYMPLAFGTLLGGMATLLTTANIVVSGVLRDQGLAGFGLLDFAAVGIPLVLLGIAYMALVGRRLLPGRQMPGPSPSAPGGSDLVDTYRLCERLFRARVPAGSALIDRPLVESRLREDFGITVVAIERGGRLVVSPPPELTVQRADVLLFGGRLEEFRGRDVEPYLEILPPREWCEEDLESGPIVVVEAVLAPRSSLIGRSLREVSFRTRTGMNVLAVWRAERPIRTGLAELPLAFGDALLLQGPRASLALLDHEPDLIVLASDKLLRGEARPHLAPVATIILAATLVLAAFSPTLVGEAMLGGALLMVLARILSMDEAYQSIEWRSIFLVGGMLPVSLALTKTGAAGLIAHGLVELLGPAGPPVLLAGFFLLTVGLAQIVSGPAVAALVAPIAIGSARQLGLDPRALAMAVALASSVTFLTPLGHPVNILVMGLGGYSFRDYLKVGLPLTLLVFAAVMLLLPLVWPLVPR